MIIFCKQCNYNREHIGEYEDYECPICGGILNENKKDFFGKFTSQIGGGNYPLIENETIGIDEVIRGEIIASFKRDIEKVGKEKVWKIIEGLMPAITRLKYRKFYFLALEELKKEV